MPPLARVHCEIARGGAGRREGVHTGRKEFGRENKAPTTGWRLTEAARCAITSINFPMKWVVLRPATRTDFEAMLGTSDDCTASPSEIAFRGGAHGFSISSGATLLSDEIPFNASSGDQLLIPIDFSASNSGITCNEWSLPSRDWSGHVEFGHSDNDTREEESSGQS